jgi:catechol 2,3-dioxygenase-like lactoylglutathione lyase family enzyme
MAQKPMAQNPMARKPVAGKPVARTPMTREQVDPRPVAPQPRPHLEFQPVVHVSDMAASVAFYQRLGAEIVHGRPDDDWVLLQVGTVQISLIAGAPPPAADQCPVELNFGAATPIEQLQRVLPGARLATDRTFGRRLLVRSPDGLLIRINQREPDVT